MEDLHLPLIAQAVLKVNIKRTLSSSYSPCNDSISLRNLLKESSIFVEIILPGLTAPVSQYTRITQVIFRYFSRRNLLTARKMAVRLNYSLPASAQRQIVIYWSNERRHLRTLEQQASRSLIVSRTISYGFP